jgi:hypothetical protein
MAILGTLPVTIPDTPCHPCVPYVADTNHVVAIHTLPMPSPPCSVAVSRSGTENLAPRPGGLPLRGPVVGDPTEWEPATRPSNGDLAICTS